MAEPKQLKLQFASAAGYPSVFADQATLQTLGETVLVTFYQTEPPAIGSDAEELDSVTAYPVARVALSPKVAQKLMGSLQDLNATFESIQK